MKKQYIITHDVRAPRVIATGKPHDPQKVELKLFRRGEIIFGELKHANNKPAFLLVSGNYVLNLDVVKELIAKEIVSNANGSGSTLKTVSNSIDKTVGLSKNNSNPKVKYVDAIIVGGLLGAGATYLAIKKSLIPGDDKNYTIYGAIAGALIGCYFIYRKTTQKTKINITKSE